MEYNEVDEEFLLNYWFYGTSINAGIQISLLSLPSCKPFPFKLLISKCIQDDYPLHSFLQGLNSTISVNMVFYPLYYDVEITKKRITALQNSDKLDIKTTYNDIEVGCLYHDAVHNHPTIPSTIILITSRPIDNLPTTINYCSQTIFERFTPTFLKTQVYGIFHLSYLLFTSVVWLVSCVVKSPLINIGSYYENIIECVICVCRYGI